MDHAERVVERFAVDRHAGMAAVLELGHQLAERRVDLDGVDVGARDHDVGHAIVAEPKDVAEEHALLGRKARVGAVALLDERLLKVAPHGRTS